MKKTFAVRNFLTREYWSYMAEWSDNPFDSIEFETIEEVEKFISTQSGKFIIETIYDI